MAFDTRYPNRKDWRKPYRGGQASHYTGLDLGLPGTAKAVDASCRNHGGCPWCEAGKAFAALRRTPADADAQVEAALLGLSFNEMEELRAGFLGL